MAQEEFENHAVSDQQGENTPVSTEAKSSRQLLMLFLVFFCLVVAVFLFRSDESSINWLKDYQAGIKMAKQKNKPVLLAFIKQQHRFSSDMQRNSYNNPEVIKYVEANFIPILIDVDKQPEIAKKYKVGYYPTHYVKPPDSDELFGPRLGYDPPQLFIKELKRLLAKMESSDK
jgi:hypothetical protein